MLMEVCVKILKWGQLICLCYLVNNCSKDEENEQNAQEVEKSDADGEVFEKRFPGIHVT